MENWMVTAADDVKDAPFLKAYTLPCTHNSCTYVYDPSIKITSTNKFLTIAQKTCLGQHFIKNVMLCQYVSVYEQLELGIRQFDIGISYFNEKIYITHTFVCIPFPTFLHDLAKFLKEYPENVIVVICKPDWNNRDTIATDAIEYEFIQSMFTVLPTQIITRELDIHTASFNDLIHLKKNVLMFYETKFNVSTPFPFETKDALLKYGIYTPATLTLNNSWANTDDIPELLETAKLQITMRKETDIKDVSFVLTPEENYKIVFWNTREKAKRVSAFISDVVSRISKKNKPTSISFDTIDENVIKTIVKLNL